MTTQNLLVELFVEELPPKALKKLGEAALALFRETVERGWGAEDDAVLLRTARERIAARGGTKGRL